MRQGLAGRGVGSLRELHLPSLEVRLQRLEERLLKFPGAPKELEARHEDSGGALKRREVYLRDLHGALKKGEVRLPALDDAQTRLEVRLLLSHRTLMGLNDAHKKHLRAVEAFAVERWQSGCMTRKLSEWV